jgi:hypothetical protein
MITTSPAIFNPILEERPSRGYSENSMAKKTINKAATKYGYPPDKEAKATETVLEQAAVLCPEWAAA